MQNLKAISNKDTYILHVPQLVITCTGDHFQDMAHPLTHGDSVHDGLRSCCNMKTR